MTLWSIARSPLIMGGDMPSWTTSRFRFSTNDEVIAVNQHSSGNRQLFNHDGIDRLGCGCARF